MKMRTMMMMVLLATGLVAYATEKNDTTIINDAQKVTIITSDSMQTIKVIGKEGNSDYYYENSISTKGGNVCRHKRVVDIDGSDVDIDLGFGLPIATNVPNGMSFAPFKSWEWILGLRYSYTPKKSLQTYSVGLWCNWREYTLDTDKMFDKDAKYSAIYLHEYPTNASDKRSSIYIFSLSVPFLFTQKFGQKSKFKFSVGPVVNFNLYGRVCNEYTLGDYENETKIKGIDYRPVTVDIMGILRYKRTGIYCKYSPMSVLKKNSAADPNDPNKQIENPQFRSVSIGIIF